MRTIAVIGLTNLGVTLARLLAATNRVDRLVFLDQDDQIAVGLAADLAASPAPHCEVVIQDPAALKAADVLVVTIGQRFLGQPDAFAQLAGNAQAIQEWRSAVTESGFSGVVLNLATPNEALTGLIQQEWQLPVQRVLGNGTITDTARLHQVVAAAVGQPASSV
ncbi:L-2-hydroxyisocaproate dehydrogenase, partial [Limosilactobacillus fermentum]|nr:L-2-hydroxyisocaproate dehydrogenase [Limosilactobacillus fermentum]